MPTLFVTCPKGLEELLYQEVLELGGPKGRVHVSGISLQADLEIAYRLCLWSRLANRVLLFLHEGETRSPEALYDLAMVVPWREHLGPGSTIAVDATCKRSRIGHSHYAALKVKDAIVRCSR